MFPGGLIWPSCHDLRKPQFRHLVDCSNFTKSALHSVRCEAVFPKHGNNSVIVDFTCLLWFFKPFDVAELASSVLLFKNTPEC